MAYDNALISALASYHGHCEILVIKEHCVTDLVMSCITDVYFVALVELLQVSEVVPTGGMWCPCLLDPWVYIGFQFAAQGDKGFHIVVMLSPEICIG
jgi:hypothetical protein